MCTGTSLRPPSSSQAHQSPTSGHVERVGGGAGRRVDHGDQAGTVVAVDVVQSIGPAGQADLRVSRRYVRQRVALADRSREGIDIHEFRPGCRGVHSPYKARICLRRSLRAQPPEPAWQALLWFASFHRPPSITLENSDTSICSVHTWRSIASPPFPPGNASARFRDSPSRMPPASRRRASCALSKGRGQSSQGPTNQSCRIPFNPICVFIAGLQQPGCGLRAYRPREHRPRYPGV